MPTEYVPAWILACDKLSHVLEYLHYSWGIDTPRDHMQANVDARAICISLKEKLIDEAEVEMESSNRMAYCRADALKEVADAH